MTTSCIFDTETGGLKPEHPTIQIAALCVDNETFETVDEVEWKIHFEPDRCDPEALEKNSYDPTLWSAEAADPETVRLGLSGFFSRHADYHLISKKGNPYDTVRLIAHNAPFDVPRLRELWGDQYTPFCWWYPLDTLQLALWHFARDVDPSERPVNFQLATLCEYFGINPSGAHDALEDCRLVAALLRNLLPIRGGVI